MSVAAFKDLCIDVVDAERAGRFWAAVLGREWHPADDGSNADGYLTGPTARHKIWINAVPEPKVAKYRVHLDIYTRTIEDLTALGATAVEALPHWTVMNDPEGAEFCAFLRDEPPAERMHGLVVDSADPVAMVTWWAGVLGVPVVQAGYGPTIEGALWDDVATFDFAPVSEPKQAKNRLHWDVNGSTDELLARGATLLRRRDDEIRWDVLADPEGNEFCVFTPAAPGFLD